MDIGEGKARYSDDRYAVQRRVGFPWLRFLPDLEAEFRDAYWDLRGKHIRAAAAVGVAGVLGFILVDQLLGSNLNPGVADWLLVLLTIPVVLVPVTATYFRAAAPYLRHMVLGSTLVSSLTILMVINIGRSLNPQFPYESLFLVLMYIYFVSGLALYKATVCGVVLTTAFLVTNWTLRDHAALLYEGFYLVLGNGVGVLGAYVIEHQLRLGFLLQNELEQQASLDGLTGLMNRRAFQVRLETAWRLAQRNLCPVGLVLIDLDDFKKINDTHGHLFGDAALQHVAHVLRNTAMRPLDVAARYGGDEFVAVWYDMDGAWFGKLVEEMPARMAAMPGRDPAGPAISVSGGAVLAWPKPGMEARAAVKLADELLYEMKRNKRGHLAHAVMSKQGDEDKAAA
jgi:diguanylate cyclase (GGDEF)-like protein